MFQSLVVGFLEIVGGEIYLDGCMEGCVFVEGEEVVFLGCFLDEVEVFVEDVCIIVGVEFFVLLVVWGFNELVVEIGVNIVNFDYCEEWFNFGVCNWDDIDIYIDGFWKVIGVFFEFFGGVFVGSVFILGLIVVLFVFLGVSSVVCMFCNCLVSLGLIGFIIFVMFLVIMVMLIVLLVIIVIGVFFILLIWMFYFVVLFLVFVFGGVVVGDLIFNCN